MGSHLTVLSEAGRVDLAATLILALVLAWLVVVDLRERRLPDGLTLPLLGIGLGLAAWREGGLPGPQIIGAIGGYAAFALLGAAYFSLRGREGLGLGDAKLLAAAGAWLGWRPLPALVLLAALIALTFALLSRQRGPLAFGPWIAAAFLMLWILSLSGIHLSFATFRWLRS